MRLLLNHVADLTEGLLLRLVALLTRVAIAWAEFGAVIVSCKRFVLLDVEPLRAAAAQPRTARAAALVRVPS